MYVCPKCLEENSRQGAQCPRDGAYFIPQSALQDAKHDPLIGTMMADKFIITSLISEGGMGAVYRALQMPVEREIAFKVLLTELQDSDKGRDRFRQEARAISKLQHPNIITMFDFGFSQTGHPYMAMEYAPGVSLAKWGQAPDLTTERILHVFEQILAALSEAHRQGIIHRDLKPDNMIITRAGEDMDFVKLLDFGIARITNETATRGLTREGEVFGTPHYMAPEQAQGKKNVGPPADVYAIGIMFYEMLCGEAPFDAASPLSVLFMHINEPMPPLKLRPGLSVPKVIEDIIFRATQKEPENRYADASQMLQALYDSVGRTTGAFSSTTMSNSAVMSTAAPPAVRVDDPNLSTAASPAPVNLGQFASQNQSSGSHDPKMVATTPPGVSENNSKKLGLILAIIAMVCVLLGAVVVYLVIPSNDGASAHENTQKDIPEMPGTISANVDIPKVDLKTEPGLSEIKKEDSNAHVVNSEKPAAIPEAVEVEKPVEDKQLPDPAELVKAQDANTQKSADTKPADSRESVQNPPKARQAAAPAVNRRPQKANSPKATGNKEVPVKFTPPKFKAPEDIPTKFERPK